MFKLVEIVKYCPALKELTPEQIEILIPIVNREPYQEDKVGSVVCKVLTAMIIDAGILYGCRGITELNSTGCILRNSQPVKVDLT